MEVRNKITKEIKIWSCEYITKIPHYNLVTSDKTKEIKRIETIKEYPCTKEIKQEEKYCDYHKREKCSHVKTITSRTIELNYNGDSDGDYRDSDYELVEYTKCENCSDCKNRTIRTLDVCTLEEFFDENITEFEIILDKMAEWEENN
ncbi:MAG: hypothetical protein OHM56_02970 [Spiroplasma phoeniceum]|nr:MAG: hypothetical protein OHM57_02420 [Spiroplasma phoeniceum]UZQ32927.1 MAG: hypothetical protein OHM56_02970 [Spiroplasma phoeniceum]